MCIRQENAMNSTTILCFHSRGQHLCKFLGTKESLYKRKEFNSHRTGLGHNMAAMTSCENTQYREGSSFTEHREPNVENRIPQD